MIYLKSILLTAISIGGLATVQFMLFLPNIRPQHYLVPLVVILVIGTLFGKVFSLRKSLEKSNKLFQAVAELGQEFSYVRNSDGSYAYVSPSCMQITGYTREEFYNDPDLMDRIIHPHELSHWHDHIHTSSGEHQIRGLDFRIITKAGDTRWLAHCCSDIHDEQGNWIGVRSTNVDVTERVEHRQKIERIANYDPLTGLPNRRFMLGHIQLLIERRPEDGAVAILYLDLNRFKLINDTHGHAHGDVLLQELADRFDNGLPDNILCARFGGDEFVFAISGLATYEVAAVYAEKIINMAEQPFLIHGQKFYISGSVGIALCPNDSDDAESLIREADIAMFKAKRSGSGNIEFYRQYFSDEGSVFLDIETRLRDALENDEFLLFYQPLVDLRSGQIIGVEALARWMNGDQGMVSPAEFIPVAEETGLIMPIGERLLEMAMHQAREWYEMGLKLKVSVNISGCQFRQKGFLAMVRNTLEKTGCPPSSVELEITENILLEDVEEAIRKVHGIGELGMRVALDDFGTGYSSFGYLRRFEFDVIKIDREFVKELENDAKSQAIVESIISLSHSLGAEVTAEGIETEVQMNLLREFGADVGQGFLLARPQPVSEQQELLEKGVCPILIGEAIRAVRL